MTDYKSMFEQAVRTLAAIDEALGIGDDGCGEPDQTLTAIAELKAAKVGAGGTAKRCGPCRETGAIHCSDPANCGGPWDTHNAEITGG